MTTWSNNFNGIASGTALTTTNSASGGTAFNALAAGTGTTITAQSTAAYEGAAGMQIVYPSTGSTSTIAWTSGLGSASGVRLSKSFYFRFGNLPAAQDLIAKLTTSVELSTSGQIKMLLGSTTLATSPAISPGAWVYIQYANTTNATAGQGRAELNVILASDGSTLLSYDSGNTLTMTASIAAAYIGRNSNIAAANTHSFDVINMSNVLASGFPGTAPPVVLTLTNTTVPTISGTATVGNTLTASNGTWNATPDSYTYVWKRAGTAISGATESTYTVTSADVGSALTVTVTAVKAGYTSGSATSAPTSTVSGGNVKIWTGSGFVAKPVKVWTGSAWVVKPAKRWTGTAWVTTPY